MIWNLQVTRKIKVSLTGIFLLGALYVSANRFNGPFLRGTSTDLFNLASAPPVRIFGLHFSYVGPDLESLLAKHVLSSTFPLVRQY